MFTSAENFVLLLDVRDLHAGEQSHSSRSDDTTFGAMRHSVCALVPYRRLPHSSCSWTIAIAHLF
jgi:hypothetical protein